MVFVPIKENHLFLSQKKIKNLLILILNEQNFDILMPIL
jgi:hypothetical protein